MNPTTPKALIINTLTLITMGCSTTKTHIKSLPQNPTHIQIATASILDAQKSDIFPKNTTERNKFITTKIHQGFANNCASVAVAKSLLFTIDTPTIIKAINVSHEPGHIIINNKLKVSNKDFESIFNLTSYDADPEEQNYLYLLTILHIAIAHAKNPSEQNPIESIKIINNGTNAPHLHQDVIKYYPLLARKVSIKYQNILGVMKFARSHKGRASCVVNSPKHAFFSSNGFYDHMGVYRKLSRFRRPKFNPVSATCISPKQNHRDDR